MPTITELRERSERLFERLLAADSAGVALAADDQPAPPPFTWFDPDQAHQVLVLATDLAVRAGARRQLATGLAAGLDAAEAAADAQSPELVRQALAMFVTHHRPARRLAKPRTVVADERRFARRRRRARGLQAGATDAAEARLDDWREDALANEHHEHWHQVYPFSGLMPSDWDAWAAEVSRASAVSLLETLDPAPNWAQIVPTLSAQQLRVEFLTRASQLTNQQFAAFVDALPVDGYRALFRLNDRQGELFFYMHQQMLARYDAERTSVGLPRVTAFGPTRWSQPIPEGYDSAPLSGYGRRDSGRTLPAASVNQLRAWHTELRDAIDAGVLLGRTPASPTVPVDRTTLGEAAEGAEARLRDLRAGRYLGIHNTGHVMIARLSTGTLGVMRDPTVAIRDPIFWRWHKYVDDVCAAWQDTQPPYPLDDGPDVVVRNRVGGGSTTWASPDLVLIDSAAFPAGDSAQAIAQLLGGANWDTSFASGPSPATDTLTTRTRTRQLAGGTVRYVTHDPFGYAVRIENTRATALHVTVRVFIAPSARANDRRSWIELDKVSYRAPSGRSVLYRPDTELSVVKKPAESDPSNVQPGDGGPDDPAYCDCGWPYTLLLPHGNSDGATYRMAVICTDAAVDDVEPQDECGSMSFCGAVDRYPDARDMGYPFSRPFGQSIGATFAAIQHGAARTFTIRHAG